MGLAQQKERSAAKARMMKENPSRYPDSVRRPHNGVGSGDRKAASLLPYTKNPGNSKWMLGMLGGVCAARLGYGSSNVPKELV